MVTWTRRCGRTASSAAACPCCALSVSFDAQAGLQGATALASSLTKRALPSLLWLELDKNELGDAELAALAPALRQLPKLKVLWLDGNNITDRGLASLLAPGVLPSLEQLYLQDCWVTDEGCATLASALRSGALPSLIVLGLYGNLASEEAQKAVYEVVAARRDRKDSMRRRFARTSRRSPHSQAMSSRVRAQQMDALLRAVRG